eukprot:Em0013g831a
MCFVASNTSNIVKSVYEEPLADVLQQLVAEFAKFMKQQRDVGDEINRHNDSAIKKVRQEIDTHCQNLAAISAKIQDEAQMIGFLKQQTSEELKNSEVAQRTRDMPSSLQYDNTAPDEYFRRMIAKFEEKMELFSNQIDELQSHLNVGGGASLTPQNLIDILQLQYKPFLVLASQLQTLHEQVESLKEQYLTYRYVFLQDTTDVFDERRKRTKLESASQQVKRGPPPFSSVMGQATAALAAATSQDSTQDRTSGKPRKLSAQQLDKFSSQPWAKHTGIWRATSWRRRRGRTVIEPQQSDGGSSCWTSGDIQSAEAPSRKAKALSHILFLYITSRPKPQRKLNHLSRHVIVYLK